MKELKKPIGLDGWDFSKEKISIAREAGSILMAYFDMSAVCNLHCSYCQAKSGRPLPNELLFEERINIINQLSLMGCESIHFAGQGEPTIDPLFWKIIKYTHDKNITPVVFTHGANLDENMILKLKKFNVSLVLKVHSFIPEKQDKSVGKKGYAKKRDRVLKLLMEAGFNKSTPTKLAIDVVITKDNYSEIDVIFQWARDNNIFPEIKTLLTVNKAGNPNVINEYQVGIADIQSLINKLLYIDNHVYGYTWIPTPPYIGWTCTFYYYHIYVNILGDIYPCVGFVKHAPIGNVRNMSIKDAFNTDLMLKIRNIDKYITGTCKDCSIDCYGCPCRRALKNGSTEHVFTTNGCWEDIL